MAKKYSIKKAFEKIKRKVMESEYEHGGLKMINMFDIQKVFYLNWIGRLHEEGGENWSAIPKWHIQQLTDFNHL